MESFVPFTVYSVLCAVHIRLCYILKVYIYLHVLCHRDKLFFFDCVVIKNHGFSRKTSLLILKLPLKLQSEQQFEGCV